MIWRIQIAVSSHVLKEIYGILFHIFTHDSSGKKNIQMQPTVERNFAHHLIEELVKLNSMLTNVTCPQISLKSNNFDI